MKLLFDENLSHKLPRLLAELFADSIHVRDVGLKSADDPIVWQYAKDNQFIIVSKDSDLHQRSFVLGHPPKLILGKTRKLLDTRCGATLAAKLSGCQRIL